MREETGDPLEGLRAAPDPADPRAPSLLRPWSGAVSRGERVLLGLPYDGGIPTRPGARFGPKALREALAGFGAFDGERDVPPVIDLGDMSLSGLTGMEAHARIEEGARRVFAAGALPFFLGGDHGCTGSIVRGLAAAGPGLRLAIVSIDAHLDVRETPALSSGTPFRRALETPIASGDRVAVIGVRRFANSREHLAWARERGIHLYHVEEVAERGARAVAAEALAALGDADALYLSVDLDAAEVPGVSAANVGGLSAREMIHLARTIAADSRLVGADVMELSPPYDRDGMTAKLGARVLLEVMVAGQHSR
jgi:formimidoylglutamase